MRRRTSIRRRVGEGIERRKRLRWVISVARRLWSIRCVRSSTSDGSSLLAILHVGVSVGASRSILLVVLQVSAATRG